MSVEITIQLYPAQGGGVQVVNTPQGPMPVPIPFLNYERVRASDPGPFYDKQAGVLTFVTRSGDEMSTNLPWLMKHTHVPDGDA